MRKPEGDLPGVDPCEARLAHQRAVSLELPALHVAGEVAREEPGLLLDLEVDDHEAAAFSKDPVHLLERLELLLVSGQVVHHEDGCYRVEVKVWKRQFLRRGLAELGVRVLLLRFPGREPYHLGGHVDAPSRPRRADPFARGKDEPTGAASDVEERLSVFHKSEVKDFLAERAPPAQEHEPGSQVVHTRPVNRDTLCLSTAVRHVIHPRLNPSVLTLFLARGLLTCAAPSLVFWGGLCNTNLAPGRGSAPRPHHLAA